MALGSLPPERGATEVVGLGRTRRSQSLRGGQVAHGDPKERLGTRSPSPPPRVTLDRDGKGRDVEGNAGDERALTALDDVAEDLALGSAA